MGWLSDRGERIGSPARTTMLNARLTPQAARTYGCRVDSLTLSIEQKTLAEERVRAAGLDGMVRIHLMDYRDIQSDWEHAFDAFISIEMLEHVGSQVSFIPLIPMLLAHRCLVDSTTRNTSSLWITLSSQQMPPWWSVLRRSPNAVIACISKRNPAISAPNRSQLPCRPQDFMRKYMWPNSCLPSATALISAANAGSRGRFTVETVENHAARTLSYPRT